MTQIVPTQITYQKAIEALLDQCFGQDRLQRTSYAVRRGADAIMDMSYVIIENKNIIGSIASWPICLENEECLISLIMVGPIAVSDTHQNMGYGRQLVHKIITAAAEKGYDHLMMIGDPEYYGQFDFVALDDNDWQLPGPYEKHRLLLRSKNITSLPRSGVLRPDISNRAKGIA